MTQTPTVSLTKLIAPSFYDVHHAIKEGRKTHFWLKGGRGSTKSSFASVEVVKGIMDDPLANGIILRKVGDTLRESVFEQYQWAIAALGVDHLWHATTSPMRLTYRKTGQQIRFRGADSPKKIKSAKFKVGYPKFIHYEEVDEFGRMEDIRSINQSLVRGGMHTIVIYTFNPPRSRGNWVNDEVDVQSRRADTYVHSSDYRSVPKEWLGPDFIRDAEHLKETKPERYEHEYLGAVTGTGAEVFSNITLRVITSEEIKVFDNIRHGLDFGFAGHPLHYMKLHFDNTRKRLYIFEEIHQVKLGNTALVKLLKKFNPQNDWVRADSAEPRTINELNQYGLRLKGAKKGPGSVEHGIDWLSDLDEIIIDPVRCPNTAREFSGYEVEHDRAGNLKGEYPDKDNHSIDACRYALEEYMTKSKWLV